MIKSAAVVVMMVSMLFCAGCPGGQTSLTIDDINRISYGTMYAAGYAAVSSHKIDPTVLTKVVAVMDKVQTVADGLKQTDGTLQGNIMPFMPGIIEKAGITDPTQIAAVQTFVAVVLNTADSLAAKYPEIVKDAKSYVAVVSTVIQGAKAGISDASKFKSKAPLPKS